ncbi:MAG: DUF2920 family protein [Planctomycetota bacterium]|nr:DUF2920 family protein [Planctomycetota bacterium]
MPETPAIYPMLMAGGASSRLWPASDHRRPKWDLRLFGPQSLLQAAWERAKSVAEAGRGLVVAGQVHERPIRDSLPDLPQGNLLIEPALRDTAAAVAYAAGFVQARDPDAVLLVLPGDQVISPVARFAEIARTAARLAAERQALVTFGIVPRYPATGYGYVHRGEPVPLEGAAAPVFWVREFKEKPVLETAEAYVASGAYYWNAGIFAFPMRALLENFARQLPAHAELIRSLAAASSPEAWRETAASLYPGLKKTSIDFGIMEHAAKIAVVASDFEWDDIGSWGSIRAHLPADPSGNAAGPGVHLEALESRGNVVLAPHRRVALIGVENLGIVDDKEGLLVVDLRSDQLVKQIAQKAPEVKLFDIQAPTQDRGIDVLIAEPPAVTSETGFLLVLHGHGNARTQYKETMVRWAARYNLVCASPEYRGSGYDANPQTGKGTVEPYDFCHLQLLDALNAYRAARLKYPRADGRRAMVWGGSQGGMLAMLCAEFAPGTFALCVSASGAAYVRPERMPTLGPPTGEAGFAIRDTRRWVERVVCPVVLMHGTADETVPDAHTRELARALLEHGKDVAVRFVHGGDHFLRPHTTRPDVTEELADEPLRHARRQTADDFELGSSYDFKCPGGVVFRIDFSSGLARFSQKGGA